MVRSVTVAFAVALALAVVAMPAGAQDKYPSKPITMIVPFAPGGATDIAARALAEKLSPRLGQTIVVENRPGAGGAVGTVLAAKAPADGYTMLYNASSTMFIVPVVESVQFDPVRDFNVAVRAVKLPLVLAASATLGVKDLKGLRDLLVANPNKYSYGSAGAGTTSHVASAAFAQMIGAQGVEHIPYRGTAPAIVDVIAGRVAYISDAMGPLTEFLKAGSLIGLAITEKQRATQFPNIPTMAEAGLPEFLEITWTPWSGIYLPKGTPAAILEQVNREARAALADPALAKKLVDLGFSTIDEDVATSQALVNSDAQKWGPQLKALKLAK
jgi:tripartite-type tricarboxylate transporter receptor subunit TctC